MDGWDGGAGGGSIEITNTVLIKQDPSRSLGFEASVSDSTVTL